MQASRCSFPDFESSNNSNVSGLAALAGLSLGAIQQDESVNVAIETMRSQISRDP